MKLRLPTIGLLRINGPDAKSFLQGQVTCDVNQVTPTNAILGAYLNQKGRIIATFRLIEWQDSYFLRLPRECIPLLQKSLQHYALFSKVTLTDVSDEYGVMGVTELSKIENACIISLTESRFEILAKKSDLEKIYSQLTTPEADPNYWDLLDIEANIPTIYKETQEQFLPHHINYAELGVDFKKGCYLGQEIVARMHYRGQLKQHLYQVEITTTTTLVPGMPIVAKENNREIGEIVMFVIQKPEGYKALVVLTDDMAISQTVVLNQISSEMTINTAG